MDQIQAKIVKKGTRFCIESKEGKNLGCYPTRKKALKRLRQIEFHKRDGMIEGTIVAREMSNCVSYKCCNEEVSSAKAKDILESNIIAEVTMEFNDRKL